MPGVSMMALLASERYETEGRAMSERTSVTEATKQLRCDHEEAVLSGPQCDESALGHRRNKK